MAKRRRLSDLYVLGKEVKFDDGQGEPVLVWLQKLNPIEHEQAFRRAAAARSRILSLTSGDDNLDLAIIEDEAESLTHEDMVERLVTDALAKRLGPIQAELEFDEEWSKDHYLQGLRDADVKDPDPEDQEAKRVKEALAKFDEQLDARIKGETESLRRDHDGKADDDLRRRCIDQMLSTRADIGWLTEFRKSEVWLAVRDPDNHRQRYFEKREELDELSHEVLTRLLTEYQDLIVDPIEGKGSEETSSSSVSSEQPEAVATDVSSGPDNAAA